VLILIQGAALRKSPGVRIGFLILLSVPQQNEDYVNVFRWASHLIGWNVRSDALDQKCTWTIRIPPLYPLRPSSLAPFHWDN